MKRQLLFSVTAAFASLASAQAILIDENFDSYVSGDLVALTAGAPWSTWSEAPGGSEDTNVSDEQAASGTNSMKVTGGAAGGPTDLILQLGNRTTGTYALSWNMYIPTGSGGYFNLQHNEVPGAGSWMLDVTMLADGTINYLVNAVTVTGTYPHDAWFSVTMAMDLGTQTGALAIDGTVQYTWQTSVPGPSQLGGVDFFAYAGGSPNTPLYYVDDVLFLDLTGIGMPEIATLEANVYPNPAQDVVYVEVPSTASNAVVTLLDITGRTLVQRRTLQQQGALARVQLDVAGLPQGLYFVRITDNDQEVVHRVTKQ